MLLIFERIARVGDRDERRRDGKVNREKERRVLVGGKDLRGDGGPSNHHDDASRPPELVETVSRDA